MGYRAGTAHARTPQLSGGVRPATRHAQPGPSLTISVRVTRLRPVWDRARARMRGCVRGCAPLWRTARGTAHARIPPLGDARCRARSDGPGVGYPRGAGEPGTTRALPAARWSPRGGACLASPNPGDPGSLPARPARPKPRCSREPLPPRGAIATRPENAAPSLPTPHRTCVRPPTGVRGPLSRRQRPVRALPAPQPATPPPLRRENSGFSSRSAVAVALGCLVEQVAHVACRDLAHVDPGHCEAVVLSRSRTVAVVATSGVGRRLLTCDRTPRSARMDRDG